jgi:hypothetical protein
MLTVFKENKNACEFYKQKLKYQLDETDPSFDNADSAAYEVLSKALPNSAAAEALTALTAPSSASSLSSSSSSPSSSAAAADEKKSA